MKIRMKHLVVLGWILVSLHVSVLTYSEARSGSEKPRHITGKDGAPMVLIPAGEFRMGSNDGEDDEKPVHTVYLDAFYIDMYEVTNLQYKNFLDATGCKHPKYWNDSRFNAPDQPVVCVKWGSAMAYADWAGKRLPTEAEWEKAARGGLVGKKYSWGDNCSHDYANYDDKGRADHTPAGRFPPNGYDLYDMIGNAWEWCADWYDENYYSRSPGQNPKGPSSGSKRVLRGGSAGRWDYYNIQMAKLPPNPFDFVAYCLRVAARFSVDPEYPPDYKFVYLGFRCAKDAK